MGYKLDIQYEKYVTKDDCQIKKFCIRRRRRNHSEFFFSITQCTSIGFHGNAVTLWERLFKEYQDTGELLVDLGSDQTSCHDPFGGGYYPVQLGFDEAKKVNKVAKEKRYFKKQKNYHIWTYYTFLEITYRCSILKCEALLYKCTDMSQNTRMNLKVTHFYMIFQLRYI